MNALEIFGFLNLIFYTALGISTLVHYAIKGMRQVDKKETNVYDTGN